MNPKTNPQAAALLAMASLGVLPKSHMWSKRYYELESNPALWAEAKRKSDLERIGKARLKRERKAKPLS